MTRKDVRERMLRRESTILGLCQDLHSAHVGSGELSGDDYKAMRQLLVDNLNTWDHHRMSDFDTKVLEMIEVVLAEKPHWTWG